MLDYKETLVRIRIDTLEEQVRAQDMYIKLLEERIEELKGVVKGAAGLRVSRARAKKRVGWGTDRN